MKIPYQIRIEPEQLEQLKKLAKENGTSVNHEIRQSIRNKTPMYNSLEGFKRFLNNDLGYDGSLNEEIEVYREFLAKK